MTYYSGIETRRSDFADFGGIRPPSGCYKSDGMVIHITEVSLLGTVPEDTFILKGHEWKTTFTGEVR